MGALRIGYVTTGSASDIGNWSGLVLHMRKALEAQGHHVEVIDELRFAVPLKTRLMGWAARGLGGKIYGYDRDVPLARSFARAAEARLASAELDCVVAPRSYPLAMMNTSLPMATWGDATFHCLRTLYPGFGQIAKTSVRQGDHLEAQALKRCSLLAYASHWAAEDAVQHYKAEPARVHVVPFGANCPAAFPNVQMAREAIAARPKDVIRLLFVGVDWERKGGPFALRILKELHRRSVPAELWIAGCSPFAGPPPKGVNCLGFLSKANSVEAQKLHHCFLSSHAFVLPTAAECFGIVFAEAASYALPSLAPRVGGVADAVRAGENGVLFEPEADEAAYADVLERWFRDRTLYQEQALNAWHCSRKTLNWDSAGRHFSMLLEEAVSEHRPHAVHRQ